MTELNQEMPKVLVRGLKKQYGDNVVLKSIDLTVNQGEVVCVIGPSGSGKSTMLRCLNRMEEINGGKVFVDGVDITDPKEDINKIRQNIGMVFQCSAYLPVRGAKATGGHRPGPSHATRCPALR